MHDTRLDEHIDANEQRLVDTALNLLAFDTQNPPGDTADIVEYIRRELATVGLETTQVGDDMAPGVVGWFPTQPAAATIPAVAVPVISRREEIPSEGWADSSAFGNSIGSAIVPITAGDHEPLSMETLATFGLLSGSFIGSTGDRSSARQRDRLSGRLFYKKASVRRRSNSRRLRT